MKETQKKKRFFRVAKKPKSVAKPVKKNKINKYIILLIPFLFFVFLIIVTSLDILVKLNLSKNNLQNAPFDYAVGLYPKIDENSFPQISAQGTIVMDRNSKVVLFAKNPNFRFAPASTTKIMTALVALDYFETDDVLTVTDLQKEGSTVDFENGEKIRFEDLLYAMLLPSSNDAALIIAANYPGGQTAFVNKMNEKAHALNLTNTNYADPVGLVDYQNYTTPQDLALLSAEAMKNDEFARIVGSKDQVVTDINHTFSNVVKNLNILLGFMGVNGIKTGYTEEAGQVLVTAKPVETQYGQQSIIIVVMQSDDRFGDSQKLIQAASKVNYLPIRP